MNGTEKLDTRARYIFAEGSVLQKKIFATFRIRRISRTSSAGAFGDGWIAEEEVAAEVPGIQSLLLPNLADFGLPGRILDFAARTRPSLDSAAEAATAAEAGAGRRSLRCPCRPRP